MTKMLAAGALGVLILGSVAVAQTTTSQNSQPNQDTTAPYNQNTNMGTGAQTSMQDGSASQWAGERG